MRKLASLLIACLLMSIQVWAQNRAVTGKVTDQSGKPISGVSIVIKGSTRGTVTNESGVFTLNVPNDAKTLVISEVGFTSREVAITSNSLSITLVSQNNQMDEVVVTGYTREKKSQFAGAASLITAKAVETVPVGSFDQALQGRAPGLLVNSSSGQPGSSASLTIRGVKSISGAGAQPLYVVDGVPTSAGDFQTMNANDFESLTVLKDANSAALYGSRGATGVIVITTKKGKAGSTNVMVRSQLGYTQAPSFDRLNMMNSSEILQYEERIGVAGLNPNVPGWVYSNKNPVYATLPATSPATNPYAASQARYNTILDSIRGINTDFSKLFYREGLSQTHDVNVSGGNDKTRFFLSAGTFDQEGIDLGSALKRYTTRFNIDHTSDKFSVQWNTGLGYSKTNLSEGEAYGNSPRNPFQMTYRAKPYENPYKADGSLNYGANTTLNLKQAANLLEGIQNSILTQKQIKLNTGITTSYRLLSFLTARNTFGVDVSSDLWQRYINPSSYIGTLQTFQAGLDQEAYRINTQLINTSSLLFSKRIKNVHEVEAGAYFEVIRGYQKALGFTLYNLDPRLSQTGQGAGTLPTNGATTYPQNASSAKSGFGIRSYFATAKYTYNGKYTINGNIRRDGTSRIVNTANKEITNWSVGANWNAMQEGFMKNQKVLSDFRVRASYGIVPNIGSIATSSYGLLSTGAGSWVGVTNYQGPQVPSFGTTSYAGSGITGLAPTTPGNPNLKIEKVQMTNVGVDFAFWNNRARFTVDAYYNKTVDLFVSQPLSGTTGFASTNINAGIMTNKGLEFTANIDVVKQRDFNVNLSFNHAINVNKIQDLGLVDEYFLGTFVIRKGLPYGSHYTYNYLGADAATGRPRYETTDGKETNDIAQAGQFAKFGTYLPKHVGGFTATVSFKGFTVDALFSYQFDVVRSNNIRNWITRGTVGYQGGAVNGSRELLTNQWQKAGDNAFFQSPAYDRQFTSSDLENAKFMRFRNLNVSYRVPAIKFAGKTTIKGARIYVQAQNLIVWSPWTGLDPEDGNNISLNEYPNPRAFVAGIDINL